MTNWFMKDQFMEELQYQGTKTVKQRLALQGYSYALKRFRTMMTLLFPI